MEFVLSIFTGVETIYNGLAVILGFNPFLILTVFLAVATLKGLIGARLEKHRKAVLTTLCFAASFGVMYLTNHPLDDKFVRNSVILGSIASFTYNTFKFILQWAVDKLVMKLEASTGKNYEDPELPL